MKVENNKHIEAEQKRRKASFRTEFASMSYVLKQNVEDITLNKYSKRGGGTKGKLLSIVELAYKLSEEKALEKKLSWQDIKGAVDSEFNPKNIRINEEFISKFNLDNFSLKVSKKSQAKSPLTHTYKGKISHYLMPNNPETAEKILFLLAAFNSNFEEQYNRLVKKQGSVLTPITETAQNKPLLEEPITIARRTNNQVGPTRSR